VGDFGIMRGRLMPAVLGGLADVERDLIRTRTAEAEAAPRPKGGTWVDLHSHTGSTKRDHPAARAGRDARRTSQELQRRHIDHSPRYAHRLALLAGNPHIEK
jgi:DNA invertase Pin-like site-specific DNA recombinase